MRTGSARDCPRLRRGCFGDGSVRPERGGETPRGEAGLRPSAVVALHVDFLRADGEGDVAVRVGMMQRVDW